MEELVKALHTGIREEMRLVVEEYLKSVEMLADLPDVSTTQELARVMRVSDDILRRTAEDGMPHVHMGREMRFVKKLIAEWTTNGKKYPCEICEEKSGKPQPPAALAPMPVEPIRCAPTNSNVTPLKSRTKLRLAEFAAK